MNNKIPINIYSLYQDILKLNRMDEIIRCEETDDNVYTIYFVYLFCLFLFSFYLFICCLDHSGLECFVGSRTVSNRVCHCGAAECSGVSIHIHSVLIHENR